MAESLSYVVVCACTGQMEAVAYIDDNRPIGGSITVSAPTPDSKQIISGTGYHPQVENWRAPEGYVVSKWAEQNVSETIWDWDDDVRTAWVIRCDHCQDQAQMSRRKLEGIADRMAANLNPDALQSTPDPVSADDTTGSYDADGWFMPEESAGEAVSAKWHPRYLIQLGALVRESQ
jgi:hypothetical protein